MNEVFEQAATQRQDQAVEFSVTGFDHVLQDLCQSDKGDDDAGTSSGGNST